MASKRKLNDKLRAEVVRRLAEYQWPSEVSAWLKEEHGIDLPKDSVRHYDATRAGAQVSRGGGKLANKWIDLFAAHRAQFLAGTSRIGIANKAYRLKRLDSMARKAEDMGNFKLAAELHEQAAKEMGGYFTNEHRISGNVQILLAQLLGISPDRLPEHHVEQASRLQALARGDPAALPRGTDVSRWAGNGRGNGAGGS